jgi:transposase
MKIHDLKKDGLTITAIAQKMGLDRKTVRRYLEHNTEPPVYGPRQPRPTLLDDFQAYLKKEVEKCPELSGRRLFREIKALGYQGGYTLVKNYLRTIRPPKDVGFEHRFETDPGKQAQVDFARFVVRYTDEPSVKQVVWLFSMVLGNSRCMYGRYVLRQDLATLVRCHVEAFEFFGGVPRDILYDRMKTAVIGEDDQGEVIYNKTLMSLAHHYGFRPRACAAYRAKTKGKVERPFRYVRQDFHLARNFQNLADHNTQYARWLAEVANVRLHGTTGRFVQEAFAEEKPALLPLPAGPFNQVLVSERRITRDGMVSVDGNLYSVPDTVTRRAVEVLATAKEVKVFEEGRLIAVHPVLQGRNQRRVAEGHRTGPVPGNSRVIREREAPSIPEQPGHHVIRRNLEVYDQVAVALSRRGL